MPRTSTKKWRSQIPSKYRSGGWVGMARKAYKGFKYLKSVLNVEHKTYDRYDNTNISPNNSGIVYCLTNIAQGVAEGERVGNSILAKSVKFDAVVKQNSAQTAPVSLRLILFRDREGNNGSVPAVLDVLKSATVNSEFVTVNRDRFQILADKKFSLPVVAQAQDKMIKIYRKLRHHVKYTGSGTTDYDEGQIWILALSDQGSNNPNWYMSSRFRYIDN